MLWRPCRYENVFASRIPLAWTGLLGTAVDWAYTTVAQARAGGRAFVLNRGKMLGGSTCVYSPFPRSSPLTFNYPHAEESTRSFISTLRHKTLRSGDQDGATMSSYLIYTKPSLSLLPLRATMDVTDRGESSTRKRLCVFPLHLFPAGPYADTTTSLSTK